MQAEVDELKYNNTYLANQVDEMDDCLEQQDRLIACFKTVSTVILLHTSYSAYGVPEEKLTGITIPWCL